MFVYYVYESLMDPRLYETCNTCDTTVYCCSFSAMRPSSAVESFCRRLIRKPPLSKSFFNLVFEHKKGTYACNSVERR